MDLRADPQTEKESTMNQFEIRPRRRRWGIEINIHEGADDINPLRVVVYEPDPHRERPAGVSWASTSDNRPELAEAVADAITQAVAAARELDDCGDSQAAPKIDEARRNMERIAGQDCPGRSDAEEALAQLEDSESGDGIEELVLEWLR
jgi:hypothetical protein